MIKFETIRYLNYNYKYVIIIAKSKSHQNMLQYTINEMLKQEVLFT